MIVNILHSTIKEENEIYFYSKLDDILSNETNGVYLINKSDSRDKYFLCENVENVRIFIEKEFKIFYNVETYGITLIILLCGELSIRLKELNIYAVDFRNKLNTLIDFTKSNKKRKIEHATEKTIAKITMPKIMQHYYCDRCE